MALPQKTKASAYIYIIDELKHIYEDILEAYHKPEKYHIQAYTSEQRFFNDLEQAPPPPSVPRILIYVAIRHLKAEDPLQDVLRFLEHLNTLSPGFEVIVLTSQNIEGTDKRLQEQGVVALIPDNENAMLRIDNLIKGILSRHTIQIKRKAATRSITVTGIYLLLLLVFLIVARFLFPKYF